MTNQKINDTTLFKEKKNSVQRQTFGTLLNYDPIILNNQDEGNNNYNSDNNNNNNSSPCRKSSSAPSVPMSTAATDSGNTSPYFMSPWNQPSPYSKSPWSTHQQPIDDHRYDVAYEQAPAGLVGSIVREEGHIYSLATSGGFLYTGSDSKNIRVWKNFKDFSGFKSNSGLVKAIVILGDKIFTGHQDGKIRVWKFCGSNKKNAYKRVGSLPTTRDYLKCSINPKSYVEVRRNRNMPWIRHYDTVSCLSVDAERGLLYSGSWDKTLKVWRLSDSKCIESINAHDDAVNSVVVGFDGLVFTGSADGTVKAWRRELVGKSTKHVLVHTLLEQENAVTSLAVNLEAGMLYAGSSDGLVNFWEREKNSISYGGVLRGHKLAVLSVAVAGNLVLSGSADKSICVWRREEGGIHLCVSVLTGHNGPVKCLAVEADFDDDDESAEKGGNQRWIVYSGSLDKSVKVWRVSENAPSLK
ncbi:hypothetical protein M9H77_20344 [Catharanthus roseus]|uniref:Uncharacterized protein n=1 Tax=Catharanthus roseus TaxID=4058 RepID=A0ACC0ANG6_CATRO|nr:hypothetical protein M9H77_20344 [Catharanthus roseus]